jgi:DNA ligase-associated metallophosphoesterase
MISSHLFMSSGTTQMLEVRPGVHAHASGALWLSEERTLFIADLHLGYGWALRRRGQLGPVQDAGARQKLESVLDELHPEHVVFLGDVVHAPKPSDGERLLVEATLRAVAERAQTVVVRGNHDRAFATDYAELGITWRDRWESETLVAVHGDKLCGKADPYLIFGHLHPALGVADDAGARQRIPVFLISDCATVLPAFSPLAAGFDVRRKLPVEIARALGNTNIDIVAATGRRCVRLGDLERIRSAG